MFWSIVWVQCAHQHVALTARPGSIKEPTRYFASCASVRLVAPGVRVSRFVKTHFACPRARSRVRVTPAENTGSAQMAQTSERQPLLAREGGRSPAASGSASSSGPASANASSSPSSRTRHVQIRPSLHPRPPSSVYTPLPYAPPATPMEERQLHSESWLMRYLAGKPEVAQQNATLPPPATEPFDRKPGVPKLSRECCIAEIRCYGRYIIPVVLIFGTRAHPGPAHNQASWRLRPRLASRLLSSDKSL